MKDIFKVINSKIKTKFPGIDIQSTDITEGFQRPSFYVDFDDVTESLMNPSMKGRQVSISILYFPSNKYSYKLEVLETLEKLQDEFIGAVLVTPAVKINILEAEGKITDGVLVFNFNIDYVVATNESKEEQERPYIEELDIEMED